MKDISQELRDKYLDVVMCVSCWSIFASTERVNIFDVCCPKCGKGEDDGPAEGLYHILGGG